MDKKITFISGVFISNVLDLFRVLEKNYEDLLKDIRRGNINRGLNIDIETRKKLNSYMYPKASRASELQVEFKKGFKGIAKRIWPKLVYIATVTGANFSIYDDKLAYFIEDMPIYSPVYAATESTIGINPYVEKIEYAVIPDTTFYEFIPIDSKENEILLIDEIKLGGIYEIVITNYAGLYRYRLGDVVKVVGFYNNTPTLEFLYRKNQVLNMVSEKTNEEHITKAIKETIIKEKINLIDYTTMPDNNKTPGRYIFYVELTCEVSNRKLNEIEDTLDKELRNSNLAYDRARNGRKLDRIKIILLKGNTFNKIKEALLSKGVSKNQIKIPRVTINNQVVMKIIENNTVK